MRNHLDPMVKKSVEDTLNSVLDAEADALRNASRYKRFPERVTPWSDITRGNFTRKRVKLP